MKKILIIHNKYRTEGGEDIAVSNEIELLKKHYDVKVLNFSNNKITSLSVLFSFFTNNNVQSLYPNLFLYIFYENEFYINVKYCDVVKMLFFI